MSALLVTARSLLPTVQTLLTAMVCAVVVVTTAGHEPPSGRREMLPEASPDDVAFTTAGVPRQAGRL